MTARRTIPRPAAAQVSSSDLLNAFSNRAICSLLAVFGIVFSSWDVDNSNFSPRMFRWNRNFLRLKVFCEAGPALTEGFLELNQKIERFCTIILSLWVSGRLGSLPQRINREINRVVALALGEANEARVIQEDGDHIRYCLIGFPELQYLRLCLSSNF